MRFRIIALAAALAGSVAFAPAAFSTATDGDEDPGTGSDNFTLVENIPHTSGGRGSDIEFATLSYTGANAKDLANYDNPQADALPGAPGHPEGHRAGRHDG